MEIAGIKLSFETQRIRRASVSAPVSDILLNASKTESLSFQPTIKVDISPLKQLQLTGLTIPNKVTVKDFQKSQVVMLFLTSFMGLLIGLAISFLL
ncbi:MAG: hypothetical protein VB029_01130 [Anaerolineaceae bacterium]|jgi:hypothetical protein|nr:hypothetical protein [Anaerolineaceae bacterium]HPT23974.1 hypothetical protein [Anaerolineaceae bacterium]